MDGITLARVNRNLGREEALYQCSAVNFFGVNAIGTPRFLNFCSRQNSGSVNLFEMINGHNSITHIFPANCLLPINYCGINNDPVFSVNRLKAHFPMLRLGRLATGENCLNDDYFSLQDIGYGQYAYQYMKEQNIDTLAPGRFQFFPAGILVGGDQGAPIFNYYTPDGVFHHKAELLCCDGVASFLHLDFAQDQNGVVFLLYKKPTIPMWFCPFPKKEATLLLLTDEIGVVVANAGKNNLSCWGLFNFDADIDTVEIEHFRGNELRWVLLNDGGEAQKSQYQKALKVMDRFDKAGIALSVMIFDNIDWQDGLYGAGIYEPVPGQYGRDYGASIYQKDEFVRLATKLGCQVPDRLKYERYGLVDMEAVESSAAPVIEKFLATGEMTLVEEFAGVPRGQVCRQIALCRDALWGDRYAVSKPFKSLVVITPGKERKYTGILPVAVSGFLKLPGEDAMTNFKGLLGQEDVPNVVVFDTEWLFESATVKNAKAAIAHCQSAGIGVVVIFNHDINSGALLRWLKAEANRHFRLMPLPKSRNAFIWEKINADPQEAIKVTYSSGQVVVKKASAKELQSIEAREPEENIISPIRVADGQNGEDEIL